MKKSAHNGKMYNLALCDEGKKVKLFLQFDIDGDGDPDVVVSFLPKKLGGDVVGDIINKLRRFFDVFGFPKVLIILSILKVDVKRWREGFTEIKRIDIMEPEKKNEVGPVETWYFTIRAVNNMLFLVLRDREKVHFKGQIILPVPSVADEVKKSLQLVFENEKYPGKIINETPDRFSFEESFDPSWFEDIVINIIPVDDKEHLFIKEK
jgi:hypothetical protein